MTKLDEADLAEHFRKGCGGDAKSYHLFLSAIAPIIRGIVKSKAGGYSNEDREDIVQDVLLAIHHKRLTWRQDTRVKPWVYAITRYKIIDSFRKRGQRKFVDIDDFSNDLAAEAEDHGDQMDILTLVAQLKGKQAQVVRAIGIDGKSIPDTAQQYQMKENAVRVNFHRGLEKLRDLGRDMYEE